jgi:hypothetical protein
MSGKILNSIPTSGEFEEVHFGTHFRHGLWVQFETNSFKRWTGCFPVQNVNGYNTVLTNQTNSLALIVAGGLGYLVDIEEKNVILKTDEHPLIESAILTQNPDYFILGTFFSIYVINQREIVEEVSPDFIIDGIYFKKQENGNAIGELSTAENQYRVNMDFEFDLETFEVRIYPKKQK